VLGRTRPSISLIVVILLVSTVLQACTKGPSGKEKPSTSASSGTGTNSEAVPFEKFPLPPLAKPTPVPAGDPRASAQAIGHMLQGPQGARQAALITAFEMVGVPVIGHDGALVLAEGARVEGMPAPAWVIQLLEGSLGSGELLSFDELFGALDNQPELGNVQDISRLILRDWESALQSTDPAEQRAAEVILAAGYPGGPNDRESLGRVHAERLYITPLQAQLLLYRLRADIVVDLPDKQPPRPASKRPIAAQGTGGLTLLSAAQGTGGAPCSMNHTEENVVAGGATYLKLFFGQVIKYLESVDVIGPGSNIKAGTKAAGFVADVASYAVLLVSLRVNATLTNPPLVRTHDTVDGEQRKLSAHVYFDPGNATMANCLRLALASVGLKGVKTPVKDDLRNVEVSFRGREGFSELDVDSRAQFRAPIQVKTDQSGVASVVVEGRHQRVKVPESAPAEDETARISIQVRPVEASFFKDLLSAVTTGGSVLKAGLETLKRMNPVPFLYDVPIRDWKKTRQGFLIFYREPYGNHRPLPVGAVSCTEDLTGPWAVGSTAEEGVAENLTFDELVSALGVSYKLLQGRVKPLQVFEVAYEVPFQGAFRLNRRPNGAIFGVEVEITGPNNEVLFRGDAELKPVIGDKYVPFSCEES
jgi:hypothetical protein